ncbi:hypothetical protein Aduo_017783 [Ancylostoma duodenale]
MLYCFAALVLLGTVVAMPHYGYPPDLDQLYRGMAAQKSPVHRQQRVYLFEGEQGELCVEGGYFQGMPYAWTNFVPCGPDPIPILPWQMPPIDAATMTTEEPAIEAQ